MTAKLLDGKILAQKLKDSLKSEVKALQQKTGAVPHLVNLIVGNDAGACAYANSQKKTAEYIGINYELKTLSSNISEKDLISEIERLNNDKTVN